MRASEDHIKFDIKSKENIKNIIILFSDYPESWIVEQKKIENLDKNDAIPINIKYIPADWSDKEIRIHIFTKDGNFYKTEQLILKKETRIEKIINDVLDFLKRIL